jgi:hypothetical protein
LQRLSCGCRFARSWDALEVKDRGLVGRAFGIFLEHLAVSDDDVQWRAKLMAHIRQELALCLAGDLGAGLRFGDLK